MNGTTGPGFRRRTGATVLLAPDRPPAGGCTPRGADRRLRRGARRAPKAALVAADGAAVAAGMALAYLLRPLVPGAQALAGRGDYRLVGLAGLALWPVVMGRYRLYRARHVEPVAAEMSRIVHASAVAAAAMACAAFLLGADPSRAWLVLCWPCCGALLVAERAVARGLFDRMRRAGRLARRVLVVGADEAGVSLARSLADQPRLGYEVIGVLDDGGGSVALPPGLVRLGTTDAVPAVAAATGADGVVISTGALAPARLNTLVRTLSEGGVHVELSSPLERIAADRLSVRSPCDRLTLVHVRPRGSPRRRAAAKRVLDVTVAAAGLVVAGPLLLALAVLIRLDSPGPALFRQARVGRGGRPFRLLKLRSMVVDAEARLDNLRHLNEASGPLFKLRRDPRVTRVGRVLRTLSLDELPQLWNVLRGDMSLVGPRPALADELAGWSPELHERLKVRPGITGLWQVSGRADASFDDYVHLDLYYVDNWSLPLDVKILLRTVPTVLCQRGAR